jgi:hypothetical protein
MIYFSCPTLLQQLLIALSELLKWYTSQVSYILHSSFNTFQDVGSSEVNSIFRKGVSD